MRLLKKQQRSANAIGGKTARACDSCLRRQARWYCAADDAFLCQACDASVHSANPLARRHERLRLKTASSSSSPLSSFLKSDDDVAPAWHQGFKRKARTPRPKPAQLGSDHHVAKSESLVPDLEAALADDAGEEEQLLYRVPVFDPGLAEFYSPPSLDETAAEENKPSMQRPPDCVHTSAVAVVDALAGMSGFLPSDRELAEFAADMETLLGRGLDDDSFCMEGLGLADSRSTDDGRCLAGSGRVKTEMEEDATLASGDETCHLELEMDLSRGTLELNFDCGSPMTGDDVEEEKIRTAVATAGTDGNEEAAAAIGRKFTLTLDYEAVIEAWSSCQGTSPWTNGERPQFNQDDCWLGFTGIWGGGEVHGMHGEAVAGGHAATGDGGREARVTRYREKRRTRLFSKKIRYEVRKLNAEKRPRMKGRFVKRPLFPAAAAAGPAFPY